MKPLILYHKDCADGFGSAVAAWMKLGWNAEYCAIQYGTLDKEYALAENFAKLEECVKSNILYGRTIYILDFSIPQELMLHLATKNNVIWIDHHETSFLEYTGKLPTEIPNEAIYERPHPTLEVRLDNKRSGAYLSWKYFHPQVQVPALIVHVDDYDRWKFKFTNSRPYVKRLYSQIPWKFEEWKKLLREHDLDDDAKYISFVKEGILLCEQLDSQVHGAIKQAKKVTLQFNGEERKGYITNCSPHLNSDVGNKLAEIDRTFGICWNTKGDGKIVCSIRSIGDYNVREIAESFKGGGHKNASGFSLNFIEIAQLYAQS
jgi:oligoribonuclease NrnB/cAMP/cGMP phosphodiesterase (DHH superfamily)